MRVFVKTVDSETIPINISPQDTVIILKIRISDEIGIEPKQQKLIFAGEYKIEVGVASKVMYILLAMNTCMYIGKTLADDRPLNEYYIGNDATVHLIKDKRTEGKITQIFIKALTGE